MQDITPETWYNRCKEKGEKPRRTLRLEATMDNRVSVFDNPAVFGEIALNPGNEGIYLQS